MAVCACSEEKGPPSAVLALGSSVAKPALRSFHCLKNRRLWAGPGRQWARWVLVRVVSELVLLTVEDPKRVGLCEL